MGDENSPLDLQVGQEVETEQNDIDDPGWYMEYMSACALRLCVRWMCWCVPLILVCGRQRQADLSEFKTSLVYRLSSRTARATGRPCLKKTKKKKTLLPGIVVQAFNPSTQR